MRRAGSIWLTGLAAAALVGCSSAPVPEATPSPSPTPTATASPTPQPAATPSAAAAGPVEPVPGGDIITGLAAPWSVAPLDDTSALVSLRNSAEVLLLTRQAGGWSTSSAERSSRTSPSPPG